MRKGSCRCTEQNAPSPGARAEPPPTSQASNRRRFARSISLRPADSIRSEEHICAPLTISRIVCRVLPSKKKQRHNYDTTKASTTKYTTQLSYILTLPPCREN